ncbi:hypothetical protein Dsi01nite_021860 [Dactylosporangium siamense]|uniref:Uncharacterized protein n=1 Tax=Dactylosporangium siamense TaxID=685454 RepID=A0A919PFZ0_9ACTN|nr:hypothetical protein Dsi01nite_021860 [Dactylosporangium siamense]
MLQLRLTRSVPDVPPCLASETVGACLVSVTLVSRTGAAGGAGGGDGTATGGAGGGATATCGAGGGGTATGGAGGGTATGGAT